MDVAHLDWQALHLMDTRFRPPSTWGSVSAVTSEKVCRRGRDDECHDCHCQTHFPFQGPVCWIQHFQRFHFCLSACGDLDLSLEGAGHMEYISGRADLLMKKLAEQWESKHIEQEELREFLPGLCLKYLPVPIIR